MVLIFASSINEAGVLIAEAAGWGLVATVGMGMLKAYTIPMLTLISRIPLIGPSAQKYDSPTENEKEHLAQYNELNQFVVKIDRSDREVPGGAVAGFRLGSFGSPGMILTSSAFENPKYLSAIVTHELGHWERNDTFLKGTFVAKFLGLAVFTTFLLGAVAFSRIAGPGRALLAISSILSFGWLFWQFRSFNQKSREAEYGADRRSAYRLNSSENIRALLDLYSDERDDSRRDRPTLVSRVFGGEHHPHPDDRIEKLDEEHGVPQKP